MNFNYTFSRTEDNLAARTGYNFDQDWAVGVNDQPHVANAIVVYDMPFGAEGRAGQRQPVVRALVSGLADLGHHAVPIGPPLGAILGGVQPAERGTCYADFNPDFTGDVAHQWRLWRRRRARRDAADLHRSQRVPVAAPPFTYGNTPRTLRVRPAQSRLLQSGSQHPPRLPLRATWKLGLGVDVFNVFNNVVFGGIQTNITNANFGRVSTQTNTPRVGQIKVVEF